MKRSARIVGWIVAGLLALAASPLPAPAVLDRGEPVAAEPVWRVEPCAEPTIYLTFDAGNAPDDTVEPLLELLAAEDVPATFFLTGRWTLAHPKSARTIAAGGHLLANHGFSHFHMEMLPAPVQLAEAWWAEQAVRLVCGETPTRLFRPPHGGTDERTESFLASHGYRTIMWTKNPNDWRLDGSVSVQSIRSAIEPLEDGDIVVFHLRNAETVDALTEIIPMLKAEGFRFSVLDAEVPTAPAAE